MKNMGTRDHVEFLPSRVLMDLSPLGIQLSLQLEMPAGMQLVLV